MLSTQWIQTCFNLVPDPHRELGAQDPLSFLGITYLNPWEVLCVGDLPKVMLILPVELTFEWEHTTFHCTTLQRTA